jgi:N4-(beta-N-acetylglucosaminyl)-L-asparaginase
MNDRRLFIKKFALGGIIISNFKINAKDRKPIVISTWDAGIAANKKAWEYLSTGKSALDAVENGVKVTESEGNCCVGLSGNPDRDGIVTLDACIMDHMSNCGSVAGMERIDHPISVARKVMELTPHVMLVGAGAQQFALENGFTLQSKELSKDAQKAYTEWLKKSQYKPQINIENTQKFVPTKVDKENHDTIGMVAMDSFGNLSGACTTSGMAFKLHGRVGDSPIIGAGLFVDNEVGAATATGTGEEVIRICGTHLVVEFMRSGLSPEKACKKAVERILAKTSKNIKELQIGFIAINKKGEHGGFAVQTGFSYAVYSNDIDNQLFKAKSVY